MKYRRLGSAGLKVSELSIGAWVTFGGQVDDHASRECLLAAYEAGVNFFDNAEAYAEGNAEIVMGKVLKELKHESYIVSTKIFWGGSGPNDTGLSRKHLTEGLHNALRRLQVDYVDLLFCHRPDPHTPIAETVWTMDNFVRQGKALYWGTSEWSAGDIRAAWEIAERHHLHKPVVEQPQYHLFHRRRVEQEYARLYEEIGLGLTTWSPLASGLLTGKYRHGIPPGSRGSLENMSWMREQLQDKARNDAVGQLAEIARELGCSTAQLAIAWINRNPRVSTVILGASRLEQLQDNLGALAVTPRLTPEVLERIDAATKPLAQ
jgi:voltage-dependent potassium channel beta subunit